jgi:asparagine synthase (glutamine-hydrolysing)
MDSSLLAAMASRRVSRALATFTLRFQHPSYDESDHARRVAKLLGSRHDELMVTETTLLDALGQITTRVSEPISDPAVLPTYLLARRAKESVGVVLSGEGADELFGGYPTYLGHKFARSFSALPEWVRSATTGLASKAAASHRRVPWAYLVHRFADHASKDWATRHLCWFGTGLFPYLDATTQGLVLSDMPHSNQDPVRAAMELDYATYLREGLLTKVDRATMLSGLEARSPFLNPRLVAFARALPTRRKVHGLTTKQILREVASKRLPRWVVRRRKRGLSVPVADLLNGGLREEADRLLSPARLQRNGLLPELPIAQLLAEHRSGQANHARPLWALLMFQYWLEKWIPGAIE